MAGALTTLTTVGVAHYYSGRKRGLNKEGQTPKRGGERRGQGMQGLFLYL